MRIEFSGTREIYVEIAEKYKEYIKNRIISVGDKLPSVRNAALEFGVNPNTVARAYSLLEEQGIIKTLPKKGVYVERIPEDTSDDSNIPDCREQIRKLLTSGISKDELIKQIEEVVTEYEQL